MGAVNEWYRLANIYLFVCFGFIETKERPIRHIHTILQEVITFPMLKELGLERNHYLIRMDPVFANIFCHAFNFLNKIIVTMLMKSCGTHRSTPGWEIPNHSLKIYEQYITYISLG